MKWTKASEPPSEKLNEHFVCMIERRTGGKVEQKPAFAQWVYSRWNTEDVWDVIEWLDESLPSRRRTFDQILEEDYHVQLEDNRRDESIKLAAEEYASQPTHQQPVHNKYSGYDTRTT